jgi:hemolysin activation/secretion protein
MMVRFGVATGLATLACTGTASAQTRLDRADPSVVERALPAARSTKPADPVAPPADAPPLVAVEPITVTNVVQAIAIDGRGSIPASAFADVIQRSVGRRLLRAQLTDLVAAVADVARRRGFVFATASVEPQPMTQDVLHVTLNEGRIDAVRVIGAKNAVADRILTKALVTGRGVRRRDLEKAMALVGNLPGVTVKGSQFLRQNGFDILLVTIAYDPASLYAQIDNRGSREIGPVRGTILANLRNVAQAGDEIGVIGSFTPVNPSEFAFVRARYSAPVDAVGSSLSVSASYGRSNPGAALKPLDIVGQSVDVGIAYARPILSSRMQSLSAVVELRSLRTDQTLSGVQIRNDRLTTLTSSLQGMANLGFGILRGEAAAVAGVPLPGVTREGDPLASRIDGDARFFAANYLVDLTMKLSGRTSLVVASSGQLATRPLLATVEIGAGGPAFGRAYDYAERTGDQGILGSAEIRTDLGPVLDRRIDRVQLFGFVDGGVVGNLRCGSGGGALLSTGLGARLGIGKIDGAIEIALPINADRFDTHDRSPRISFRLARSF